MRSLIFTLFSSMVTLATFDLALAQSQDEAAIEKSKKSVCLPKYRLLAERNSEVPMQAALCSTARTTHVFPTRDTLWQEYEFHEKIENHLGELVVHIPFRMIQLGLSTTIDKEYVSTSGYSNSSKRDQTTRSDTAYIGIQWTTNLNTTVSYLKEYVYDYYGRERFMPSFSYRPFGSFLSLNASFIMERYRLVPKLAAFAEINDSHEIGLISQPVFGSETTTQKELLYNFTGDGYVSQTRFILQEYKGNSDYRSFETSDGYMLSQDLGFEIFESSIVGGAVSYASYKKFSTTDLIIPDDFESPSYELPATESGYGWSISLNYSYLL